MGESSSPDDGSEISLPAVASEGLDNIHVTGATLRDSSRLAGLPGFPEYNFGLTSAEAETENTPELLVSGYYDLGQAESRTRNGREYLVLGYKGSGKSAIGQRLHLLAEGRDFARPPVQLVDFPFSHFARIAGGAGGAQAEFPTAWSFLLSVLLLEHFSYDTRLDWTSQRILKDCQGQLQQAGITPGQDISRLAKVSSDRTFGVNLGRVMFNRTAKYEQREAILASAAEYLKERVTKMRTPRRHLLVLDGLDEVLLANDTQYNVLSALIEAVDRLNKALRAAETPAKVVVLCRTTDCPVRIKTRYCRPTPSNSTGTRPPAMLGGSTSSVLSRSARD